MGEGKVTISPVDEVKEGRGGLCVVCGRRATLGNELCEKCWDENDGTFPAPTKAEFFGMLKQVSRKIK